ncbi:MAG: M15 family metallopeptidase [Thermoanaerobacterales bacterium]|nr:M15 family metallopeptidase [Bacillota bacterium]MDI6905921.1 M15 family metallopeptidase [Thermoanaerobacterales bacterium]
MAFSLVLLAGIVLFPVEEGSRPLEQGQLGGKQIPLVVLGGGEGSLTQYDVRSVWLGVGRGAPPGGDETAEMLILDGRAFLAEHGRKSPAPSRALVDVEHAVGLADAARPAAFLSLSPGRPVTLAELNNQIISRLSGPAFVLGVGELVDISWRGKARGVLAGYVAPPGSHPLGGARDGAGEGEILWLETPVPFRPVMTPQETVAAARDGCARTSPAALGPGARFVSAAVYAWPSQKTKPAQDIVDPPLVDLSVFAPDIMQDVRYATPYNFTGQTIYPAARCYLARPVAERLSRVNRALMRQGYRLKVFDGYRPTSAHWRLWELAENRDYLASPWSGSRHSRGAAVDLTLVTLDGRPLEMPTEFDAFSDKAHRQAPMRETVRHNLEILTRALVAENFYPLPNEWWHFDYLGWAAFPLRDIPLD